MKTTSWDQTKAILHSVGTVVNQGNITTKQYIDTKANETRQYVDTEVSKTESYVNDKFAKLVGNIPVADQIAKVKSTIPESDSPFKTLVTNEDGEMKWEERTHHKEISRFELTMDEENESNIRNEDGDTILYFASWENFWLTDSKKVCVEFEDWYGDNCTANLKITEHEYNFELSSTVESAHGEHIYVINSIPEDSVTINGHVFTEYGIYSPPYIYQPNSGGDLQDVYLNELVCVEYKKLDPAYIPDEVKLPTSNNPNMMLVTDDEGNARWEERTHWTEDGGIIDILPETTLEGEDGQFVILEPFAGEIVVGQTYTVTYDGTDYICTAFQMRESEDAPAFSALGNQIVGGGEDTGEPFVIAYIPPDLVSLVNAYGIVMHMSGLISSVTVRIQGGAEIVHPLDPKYLSNLRGQKKIEVDLSTGLASVDFSVAWAMDMAELQASLFVVETDENGNEKDHYSVYGLNKQEYTPSVSVIQFTVRTFSDTGMPTENLCSWYSLHHNLVVIETKHSVLPVSSERAFLRGVSEGYWQCESKEETLRDLGLGFDYDADENGVSKFYSGLVLESIDETNTEKTTLTADGTGNVYVGSLDISKKRKLVTEPEDKEPHMQLVTDGEGNTKWDERTHWKEEGVIDYFPQTVISGNGVQYVITTPFAQQIVEGETYTVTIDGVDYVSEAKTVINEGVETVILGNTSMAGGEDSGEPYGLVIIPPEMVETAGGAYGMLVADTGGASEVTLRIWKDGTIYHKLAPEFLPIPLTSGADILPETTAEEGVEGTLIITTPFASKIVVGKTYTVTYNGADYTCRAFGLPMDESGMVMAPSVGNQAALGGEDTGEPFIIAYIPLEMVEMIGGYGMVMDMTGASSATVRIQGTGDVKIDNSALDMDWVAKYDNVGETIVAETVGEGNDAEVAADTSFFVEGAAFIAYVDNVRYDLTVLNHEGELVAGNLGLVVPGAPGNGEPFYITAKEGKLTFFRAWGDDNDALHTIAVYLPGNSKRVPNRKLPNDFLSGVDVFYVELANGKINRRYDEILAAYEMGRTVCIRTYDDAYQKTDVYHLTHIYGNVQEMYFSQFLNGKMTEIVVTAYDFDTQEYDKVTIRGYDLNLTPKCTTISIPSASWIGDTNPYSQVVTVNGATANSKIDLQPTAAQIVALQETDIAQMAENNNGVVTIYAIGGKPATDLTMQAMITEVAVV